MSTKGLNVLSDGDLEAAIEEILAARFAEILRRRESGHCMRVSNLDEAVMQRLCQRLKQEVDNANVRVLQEDATGDPVAVSPSKVVELRNPRPDGTLRPPFLVFIPNGLRTSSEDSFGVATFEEIEVGNVYEEITEHSIDRLPVSLRAPFAELVDFIRDADWPWADERALARFVLTVLDNEPDAEVIGASLYELGLIPDFSLLSDRGTLQHRVRRNLETVRTLTYSDRTPRTRVFEVDLRDASFRTQLSDFLAEAGIDDPKRWTREIIRDRANWKFSFDKWPLEQGQEPVDSLCVKVTKLDVPILDEESAEEGQEALIGQNVLPIGGQGIRKFGVRFETDPIPSNVRGLDRFELQVRSQDGSPVGLVRKRAAWSNNRNSSRVTFKNLGSVDWDEGWYYVRVLAYTEDDDLVPLVDEEGKDLPWGRTPDRTGQRPNESELFYVLPDDEVDVEPPQRAVPRYPSRTHAALDLKASAILNQRDASGIEAQSPVRWSRGGRSSDRFIEVKFGSEGKVNIPVVEALKTIEQGIIADPKVPVSWRINVDLGEAGEPLKEPLQWPEGSLSKQFLDARSDYLNSLCGEEEMITQGADLTALRPLASQYASAYRELLDDLEKVYEEAAASQRDAIRRQIRAVLSLDQVRITVTDHMNRSRNAILLGPTHPLRALWLTTWDAVAAEWLQCAEEEPDEFIPPVRQSLLDRLVPHSVPPVVPGDTDELAVSVDSVHPFWNLYAPASEEDPRGLVGTVTGAIGLPNRRVGGETIDGEFIAKKLSRYLQQHPYVRTLTINVFNPGRAELLVDALTTLQGKDVFADLRYDVRLFAPDPNAAHLGEAFDELFSPSGTITSAEADALAGRSGDHLHPKLAVARVSTSAFRSSPDRYDAHVSLLLDVFPPEQVQSTGKHEQETAPVHGLVQDIRASYEDDEEIVRWRRQPQFGRAQALQEAPDLPSQLTGLADRIASASVLLTSDEIDDEAENQRPVISLELDAKDRTLVHEVHEVSDWVFTLDRNLGIEFFDHGGTGDRPDYLIDYSPGMESVDGEYQFVITSRSVAEVEALLRTVLQERNLPNDEPHSTLVLRSLQSLSGQLPLKLIAAPTQRTEALGLSLARLFLKRQSVLANQIVVPLDAHTDLYEEPRRVAEGQGESLGLQRTDLALFDLNSETQTIRCNLVEVKCHTDVGDLGAYTALKKRVAEQIRQSEQVLQFHFDPGRKRPDRPDRPLKVQQLRSILRFYLDRSSRFGLIDGEAEKEARTFLACLEDGYRLTFTRSGVVFDFEKIGISTEEEEYGVQFFRIGTDLIPDLIEEPSAETTESTDSSTVPVIDHATFTAEPRNRSDSAERLWDRHLASSQSDDENSEQEADLEHPSEDIESETSKSENRDPADRDPRRSESRSDSRPASSSTVSEPREADETPSVTGDPSADYSPEENERGEEGAPTDLSGASTSQETQESGEETSEPRDTEQAPDYDVLIGANDHPGQYGLLGEVSGRKVALDLNQTHTISLFGVQGGGKSYTLGTIAEMATAPISRINALPNPLATIIFHYSPTQDYQPEFTSMVHPNSDEQQLATLQERYGAEPDSLDDVVLIAPEDKVEDRREEFPDVTVRPLRFGSGELQASHWTFLMGAAGNQSAYLRQLKHIMRQNRDDLSVQMLRREIENSSMSDRLKDLANMRLDWAGEYIGDEADNLQSIVRPGRLVIVDIRDEFIEKDEALGLFVVLLQLFSDAQVDGSSFNKLIVFDEAHKYIDNPDLVDGMIEVVREMRHKGTSVMVASQDPPSVPVSLIELSSQIIMHQFNSPAWLKHIQKANAALNDLNAEAMARLETGEAYVWSSKATDGVFSKQGMKIKCRPRVTRHGGATQTAM
jgi:hypothetical protein